MKKSSYLVQLAKEWSEDWLLLQIKLAHHDQTSSVSWNLQLV